MNSKIEILFTVIIAVICVLLGLVIGKLVYKTECEERIVEIIEYLPSDTVYINVETPKPYKVEVIKEIPIHYFDTVTMKVDSAMIIADFLKKNYYDQVLLDDSTGYIRLQQIVSLNEIQEQNLTFVPITKVITREIYMTKTTKLSIKPLVGVEYRWNKDSDLAFKGGLQLNKFQLELGYSLNNVKSVGINKVF